MFAEVARRMGWRDAFAYPNAASIFREHAALSAFENDGKRLFDLGALASCDDESDDDLSPVQWPCRKGGAFDTGSRLFARGGFSTPDRRARMIPVTPRDDVDRRQAGQYTLKLNTGRIRDQWHTMTRTGRVQQLMTHIPAPQLVIHPRDAEARGLTANALAQIESEHGSAVMRVAVSDEQRIGEVFAPMHWNDQFSSASAICKLVTDQVDAISGQPNLKGSWVRISAVEELWTGSMLRRSGEALDLGPSVYWSKVPVENSFAFDMAGWSGLSSIIRSETALRRLLRISPEAEVVSYSDPKKSVFRFLGLTGDRLDACLYLAPAGAPLPTRDLALPFLGRAAGPVERLSLLAAHLPDPTAKPEKVVCACFSIGDSRISTAIREKGLKTVGEIGAELKAGTNCGSCIPELKRLLQKAMSESKTLTMAN